MRQRQMVKGERERERENTRRNKYVYHHKLVHKIPSRLDLFTVDMMDGPLYIRLRLAFQIDAAPHVHTLLLYAWHYLY